MTDAAPSPDCHRRRTTRKSFASNGSSGARISSVHSQVSVTPLGYVKFSLGPPPYFVFIGFRDEL